MSSNEEQIRIKKKYQQELINRYEALYAQMARTIQEADKRAIQNSINDLDIEIAQLGNEIKKIGTSDAKYNDVYRGYSIDWEEKLPQINFSKSKSIIKYIFDQFEKQQEEQALFLLQRNSSMGGDLCIKHIKSLLQKMGTWYPPCEHGFPPHQQANPIDFLNTLASKFTVEPIENNVQTYTRTVVHKICDALRSGNIFLIQVEIYSLNPQDTFLKWFVNEFWNELVQRVSIHRGNHPFIRLVSVIAVRGMVPQFCLQPSWCCTKQRFDGKKILELPLQFWTEVEICNWLWRFSGLDAPHIGRTRSEIEQMARVIYEVSEGKPSDVCNELMEALRKAMTESAS